MISARLATVTEAELSYIAALDYGADIQRHLAALRAVIFEQGGALRRDQSWYPYEVIELGSHRLAPGHEREFFFCTMLVLQAVMGGVDRSTNLADKLADRAADYAQLPPELQGEVLRAYRDAAVAEDPG